jgi:hypothetical protein
MNTYGRRPRCILPRWPHVFLPSISSHTVTSFRTYAVSEDFQVVQVFNLHHLPFSSTATYLKPFREIPPQPVVAYFMQQMVFMVSGPRERCDPARRYESWSYAVDEQILLVAQVL